jgi:hypothetical protein
MLVLFDHSVPAPLSSYLTEHTVAEARDRGWDTFSNGDLLTEAARAGYDVLLTADKNIRYQQNLSGRKIAIVVLGTPHLLSGNVAAPKSFEGKNETRGFSGGTIQCR